MRSESSIYFPENSFNGRRTHNIAKKKATVMLQAFSFTRCVAHFDVKKTKSNPNTGERCRIQNIYF